MFAGHLGAALAIGRAERRANVGVFVAAALLLDVALWIFVILGLESVRIPIDFPVTHQPEYIFPYSHGLLAALAWSILAGAAAAVAYSRLGRAKWRVAALIASVVLSHWLLDVLVHRPELPLLGTNSPAVGLGLWRNMPLALFVEGGVVFAGLFLFTTSNRLSRRKMLGIWCLTVTVLIFTIAGMTVAPAPPSPLLLAESSLALLLLVIVLFFWLGRPPHGPRA